MMKSNKQTGDSGQIAEELLATGMPKTERRCYSIKETVKDGVFTLEKALKAYEVSAEDYKLFLEGKL